MLTRDYCCFCKGQINDREKIVQHSTTGKIAHQRCLVARGHVVCTEAHPKEFELVSDKSLGECVAKRFFNRIEFSDFELRKIGKFVKQAVEEIEAGRNGSPQI